MKLQYRDWVNETSEQLVQRIAAETEKTASDELIRKVYSLAEDNKHIHEKQCFNLYPATNVMNPKAEKLLSAGIGSPPIVFEMKVTLFSPDFRLLIFPYLFDWDALITTTYFSSLKS